MDQQKKILRDKEKKRKALIIATKKAMRILKPGDRVGAVKCPGTKRVFTFSHFAGLWIVSKSGIDDYSANTIYSINGKPVRL